MDDSMSDEKTSEAFYADEYMDRVVADITDVGEAWKAVVHRAFLDGVLWGRSESAEEIARLKVTIVDRLLIEIEKMGDEI
jgi:hypothetical protein